MKMEFQNSVEIGGVRFVQEGEGDQPRLVAEDRSSRFLFSTAESFRSVEAVPERKERSIGTVIYEDDKEAFVLFESGDFFRFEKEDNGVFGRPSFLFSYPNENGYFPLREFFKGFYKNPFFPETGKRSYRPVFFPLENMAISVGDGYMGTVKTETGGKFKAGALVEMRGKRFIFALENFKASKTDLNDVSLYIPVLLVENDRNEFLRIGKIVLFTVGDGTVFFIREDGEAYLMDLEKESSRPVRLRVGRTVADENRDGVVKTFGKPVKLGATMDYSKYASSVALRRNGDSVAIVFGDLRKSGYLMFGSLSDEDSGVVVKKEKGDEYIPAIKGSSGFSVLKIVGCDESGYMKCEETFSYPSGTNVMGENGIVVTDGLRSRLPIKRRTFDEKRTLVSVYGARIPRPPFRMKPLGDAFVSPTEIGANDFSKNDVGFPFFSVETGVYETESGDIVLYSHYSGKAVTLLDGDEVFPDRIRFSMTRPESLIGVYGKAEVGRYGYIVEKTNGRKRVLRIFPTEGEPDVFDTRGEAVALRTVVTDGNKIIAVYDTGEEKTYLYELYVRGERDAKISIKGKFPIVRYSEKDDTFYVHGARKRGTSEVIGGKPGFALWAEKGEAKIFFFPKEAGYVGIRSVVRAGERFAWVEKKADGKRLLTTMDAGIASSTRVHPIKCTGEPPNQLFYSETFKNVVRELPFMRDAVKSPSPERESAPDHPKEP